MRNEKIRFRSKSSRVYQILDALKEGRSSAEINAELDDIANQRELGKRSEKCVLEVLNQLPYVYTAHIRSDIQSQDHLGHDLSAILNIGQFPRHFHKAIAIPDNKLYIEVKSSKMGIAQYQKEFMSVNELDTEPEYWARMQKNRRAILNGQLPPDRIAKDFWNQVAAMNIFWLERPDRMTR